MKEKLSFDIFVNEEYLNDGQKVFVVESKEFGIADQGFTLEEAISNLRKALFLVFREKRKQNFEELKNEIYSWEKAGFEDMVDFEKKI